jgi:hypothetical protein
MLSFLKQQLANNSHNHSTNSLEEMSLSFMKVSSVKTTQSSNDQQQQQQPQQNGNKKKVNYLLLPWLSLQQ